MTFDSWSAIDSGDSVIRNRKITTVVLGDAFGLVWPRWSPAVENEIDGFLRPELQHEHAILEGSRGGPWQDLIRPVHEVLLTEIEPQPQLFDSIGRDYCRAIQIFGRHLAELIYMSGRIGI